VETSFYQLTFKKLESILTEQGFNNQVASDLFNWHYKKKIKTECELKISNKAKDYVYSNFDFTIPEIIQSHQSEDRTVKFLIKLNKKTNEESNLKRLNQTNKPLLTLPDFENSDFYASSSDTVEAVLIPFQGKYTLCVSSQVGCAMKCSFCYTGTQGLKRSLATSEIIGQFLAAYYWLLENRPEDTRISNIVFMGQGEPLHNFESVKEACEIFLSQNGLSIGPQKITVSTSGFLPGLKKWKDNPLGVNLALSLHSTDTKIRNELIPINQKHPLNEVLSLIDEIPLLNKQFVTYEYLLISDLNDSTNDAQSLGELLKNKRALINLIPFNPFPGSKYLRPSDEKVLEFKNILDEFKIPSMIRTTKGDDVLAACGQLNTKKVPGSESWS
jgi:23S rRNA (adenine2503-C2)-methyltransferase